MIVVDTMGRYVRKVTIPDEVISNTFWSIRTVVGKWDSSPGHTENAEEGRKDRDR